MTAPAVVPQQPVQIVLKGVYGRLPLTSNLRTRRSSMPWIKLSDLSGNVVQLSVDQMVRVRIPAAGEADPKAKAVVDLSNGQIQAVTQTIDEVMKILPK
jgi:hypothetical protein